MAPVVEIEAALDKLARLVDAYGDRFLPHYEAMARDLDQARATEDARGEAKARARAQAVLARLRRDPDTMAMLA